MNTDPSKSAQPCGCDPGQKIGDGGEWYTCSNWPNCDYARSQVGLSPRTICHIDELAADAPYVEAHAAKLEGIHDSGQRQVFSSGAMRDPSTGKLDWTRVTFGPMLRRWALHLTRAEVKYPDAALGVPNFSLIETEEEYIRYKKSAYRHFMSWFYNETDEDHAAATFFNINGVEIIKAKARGETLPTMKDATLFKQEG